MIEDVDNAGFATVAGAGGGSQKAESVVSAGERNQSRSTTAVKNNVPSSSQSDHVTLHNLKYPSERDDWTYSQRIHIDDENKMLHSTRLDPHLHVASSIL